MIQKVKHLKETKNLSVTDISKLTGVSSPTIYKVLKEHLGYVSNRLVKLEEIVIEKEVYQYRDWYYLTESIHFFNHD